ncbi:MAG: LysR family transcriptional regulator [Candidatus Omnitrophica bacterium]|nr:LysR family transcriptional regulator [Candidatus Omnitrophota bacterium]
MINLFFLKTFVDTAKTGSFHSAAQKNYVTQPAVTQHVKILEDKFGCKFFERQNKKIVLTPCGKTFLPYAENILKQYEESKMRLKEMKQQFTGMIRLATIYSIGLYELQPVVKHYLKKFPKIDIRLEYHPFEKIYEMTANRGVDFGFVAYPKKKYGIIHEVFDEEKLVLAQSSHHPVIRHKKIRLADLNKANFVAFAAHTPTRDAVDEFLMEKGIRPNLVSEYDNIETLKSAIQLGIGCSLVPRIALAHELKDRSLEIIDVRGLHLRRPLGILYAKEKIFTESTQAFYNLMMGRI